MTATVSWRVVSADIVITAEYDPPTAAHRAVFVCAHGAGGHMADRGMLAAAAELRRHGIGVVRFNFPYREQGSQRPDAMPRLQASVAAVAEHTRAELAPRMLLIGGRSMGGRAASMLAATGYATDGVLLLAYPLHPAELPTRLRDAHLGAIAQPVLCVNGTRDALCRRDLMEAALARQRPPRWTMHWVDGADHSFHVLKRSGRTDADVLAELGRATSDWLAGL